MAQNRFNQRIIINFVKKVWFNVVKITVSLPSYILLEMTIKFLRIHSFVILITFGYVEAYKSSDSVCFIILRYNLNGFIS